MLTGNTSAIAEILSLAAVAGKVNEQQMSVMSLKPNANSRGAWEMGLAKGVVEKPAGLYLLIGDEEPGEALLEQLRGFDYLVVQASYESRATEMADVVLPSPTWAERDGTYVSIDGRIVEAKRLLEPATGIRQDGEVLSMIAEKLERILIECRA